MIRLARLLAATGLTLVTALGGVSMTAGPASASALPIGECTPTSGVVLAVDFSHWGGPLLRSCGTTPTTGYTLLNEGGWATTGTKHDGPAFICRIGYSGYQGGTQYPTPAQDACVLTPPASAYWSYWHADPGQNTWSYSQLGAMSYHPVPGSVDAWVFGATDIDGTRGGPVFSPDSVRAHNAPAPVDPPPVQPTKVVNPPPATQPVGGTSGGGTTTTGSGAPGGGGRTTTSQTAPSTPGAAGTAAPSPTGSPSASASATAASPSASDGAGASPPAPVGAPGAGTPRIVDAAPAAAAKHSTGSVLPVVLTVLLVLGIGGATGYTAWRRRRQAG